MESERIIQTPTPLVEIFDPLFTLKKVKVFVKKDFLTHEQISGNKYRKLKYNLKEAKLGGFKNLLTFGGAYSNHIHAFAAACKLFGFRGTAIIRGDELNENSSPTLKFADENDLILVFVSRTDYRNKHALEAFYGEKHFVIPEGGSNSLCLEGLSEMTDEILAEIEPDYICTAAGTGGTAAGILSNKKFNGKLIVIPVLKNGDFIKNEIMQLGQRTDRASLKIHYHFGGYAKDTPELLNFMEKFEAKQNIPLEQVYTGKLFFAIYDLIAKGEFKEGSKIVIYHSGGLQGRKKSLP